MQEFRIVEGDRLPELTATFTDANGVAVDISGLTITFVMTGADSGVNRVNAAAAIVDGPTGRAKYSWLAADTLGYPGYYCAHFRVTFSGSRTMSFPNSGYIWVRVLPKLV